MKKLLFAIIMIFFVSCSDKVNEVFKKDTHYITLTQYTKRGEIVNSLETIALINVTYLNHILKDNNETKNNEIFIIGVYNSNDYKKYDEGGLFNPNFTLTMNGFNFTKAVKADIVKLNITDYPFYNKWMKYYKVYFPKTDKKTLTIKYSEKTKGNIILNIAKNIYKTDG
jgi:hypothetical protein